MDVQVVKVSEELMMKLVSDVISSKGSTLSNVRINVLKSLIDVDESADSVKEFKARYKEICDIVTEIAIITKEIDDSMGGCVSVEGLSECVNHHISELMKD